MEIKEAVRTLRQALGDTQQAFAHRLGLAISTVVRYELTRAPRGVELARFWKLAVEHDLRGHADTFALAMAAELDMKAERIPRTMEEHSWVDFLFLAMRNRHIPEVQRCFAEVQRPLLRSFRIVADEFRRAGIVPEGKVVGINADDLQVLEVEAEAFERELERMEAQR